MPLYANTGGLTKHITGKEYISLKEHQARHIYKKVQTGNIIKVDTIKQETEQGVDRMVDTCGDINPYCKIIVSKVE